MEIYNFILYVAGDSELTARARANFDRLIRARLGDRCSLTTIDVLAEPGCLEYGPTVDVATGIAAQPALRENVVTIVEKWESLDHLKQHLAAPHMQAYRPKVKELIVGTTLAILSPA